VQILIVEAYPSCLTSVCSGVSRAFPSVASVSLCFPVFFFRWRGFSGMGPIPMDPYKLPGNETLTPDPSA
jgi:hypothetical protein